ncbi:MAG TPA: hypothetical protein VNT42_04345 [Sphingomonas sp.]|nr:hypothetical protein [Sphingomonas sp.]
MVLMFLLAIAIEPPAVEAADPAPPHIYLHPPADRCDSRTSSDEVVVCANRNADQQYRLKRSDDHRYDQKPVRAEVRLFGNSTLAAHADSGMFGSKRLMITFALPF